MLIRFRYKSILDVMITLSPEQRQQKEKKKDKTTQFCICDRFGAYINVNFHDICYRTHKKHNSQIAYNICSSG